MDSFEIDENLVRSLVQEQHPDLAGLDVREVAGGWDNQLWRLGDELAVRMPRTERAPSLLRKEHRWLPALAPRLPLPVPTPMRIGAPSTRFPRPWTIATWVPGEPADRAPISNDSAADTLAGFLKALHVKAPADAPVRSVRIGAFPSKRSRTVSKRDSRKSPPEAMPLTSGMSATSGTRPLRVPIGRARLYGCMATFIQPMSSSRTGHSRA